MACFQWNARMGQSETFSPSKSLTRASENTSGLKLERANGLARWTDQHKGEESGGVACRCRMTSFRRGVEGVGGADKDKQHDRAVLPSWVSSSHLPSAQAHAARHKTTASYTLRSALTHPSRRQRGRHWPAFTGGKANCPASFEIPSKDSQKASKYESERFCGWIFKLWIFWPEIFTYTMELWL